MYFSTESLGDATAIIRNALLHIISYVYFSFKFIFMCSAHELDPGARAQRQR